MSNRTLTYSRSLFRLMVALVVVLVLLMTLHFQRNEYYVQHYSSANATLIVKKESDHDAENAESKSESCLRPRRNNDAFVKSPLKPPFINLGMPKMGSSSLHSYFQCGGYKYIHWECGKRYCGECIEEAIQAGLPPVSACTKNDTDAFTQIDRGPENLVQVNYLNEIVRGVPNATFILTFRNITKWYMSMSNWKNIKFGNLRQRFERETSPAYQEERVGMLANSAIFTVNT